MVKLVRKNLMVDAEALRSLAQARGTSESRAVRDAVERELGLRDWVDAMEALAELVEKEGAFSDFEELFGEPEIPLEQVAEKWDPIDDLGTRPKDPAKKRKSIEPPL